MLRNRRAALELSITAIVVLIIAITVLGLGIGFIKKQFEAGTELVSKELSNIKEQIKQQVKTGGELLVFPEPEPVGLGKTQNVIVGVRNTVANTGGDRVCFRVEFKCVQPFTPEETCIVGKQNPLVIGGYDMDAQIFVQKSAQDRNWFQKLESQFDIKNYDGEVKDAILQVRNARPDAYSMEVNVYKAIDDKACADGPDFSDKAKALYASKSFTLNVV
ncbi:hypothetical protein HY489_01350 [Candidatus Woesearchaeota archaeon]|nr:hypothetical protein [Candidatus Woesearchaeota archaeon]